MSQATDQDCFVSGSLAASLPDRFRGHVDTFDRDIGIEGWALDLEQPDRTLSVELVVDAAVVATTATGLRRDDIIAALGREVMPGFRFPAAAMSTLLPTASTRGDLQLALRIAGTTLLLPSHRGVTRLADLQEPDGLVAAEDGPAEFNLLARLAMLRSKASMIAGRPLRPRAEHLIGYIEALAMDEAGSAWLVGWMQRRPFVDAPAIVVDRQKVPAGLAFTYFDRDDLGATGCGIIGVLCTSWRPSEGSEIFVYLGDDGLSFLQSSGGVRLISMQSFCEHFDQKLPRCHTGHTAALQQMMRHPETWLALGPGGGVPTRLGFDRILVLPGFGALAEGWVLSPLQPVVGLALRLGAAILLADRDLLFFTARPDLAGLLPGNEQLLDTAGFTVVFRGALAASDLINPVAKVIYQDGGTSNHSIDIQSIRRLGLAVEFIAAATLYPALVAEPFFPEFGAAVRQELRARLRPCRPHTLVPAARAIIFAVPDDRSDVFLLFAGIESQLRNHSDPPGVILVAGSTRLRAEVVALFSALAQRTTAPCSLVFVDDAAYAFYTLPAVLTAARTRGFSFVGQGIFLTDAGWQAVRTALDEVNPELAMLEITDPGQPDGAAVLSAEGFVWSAPAFLPWLDSVPLYVSGFHAENGLDTATAAPRPVYPAAAQRSRLPFASPLVTAINRLADGN